MKPAVWKAADSSYFFMVQVDEVPVGDATDVRSTSPGNCKHIANATMRGTIEAICRSAGLTPPIICTPEELASGSLR